MDIPVWHTLRVKSGTEVAVACAIALPSYVPHRIKQVYNRKHRRTRATFVPALPGFVFVGTECPFMAYTTLPGVIGWAHGCGTRYLTLTDQDFRDMRHLEKAVWWKHKAPAETPQVLFRPGDRVQFTDDSVFAGVEATIERIARNRALFRIVATGLGVEADISHVVAA